MGPPQNMYGPPQGYGQMQQPPSNVRVFVIRVFLCGVLLKHCNVILGHIR